MSKVGYHIKPTSVPRLGLIVLRVDETIEGDFRHYILAEAARLHTTRVQSGDLLTPGSIHAMGDELTQAAALLPSVKFDVIGYACTSATAQIGASHVKDKVRSGAETKYVTDPLSAAVAYIKAKGLERIGMISPYTDIVAEPLKQAFDQSGINIAASLTFGEDVEARVAHIDPASTADAARSLAQDTSLDGIFLSCTNLQTRTILSDLTRELGRPVFSSNQVLAWHMAELAEMHPVA